MIDRIAVAGDNHRAPFLKVPADLTSSVQIPTIRGQDALKRGLILSVYLLFATSFVFAQEFSPPLNISNDGNSMIPAVAADPVMGYVYVVYRPKPMELGGAGQGLWFKRSTDGGATFLSPIQIDPTGFEPSMTVDNTGSIWITFSQQESIGVMRSDDHGASFSPCAVPSTEDVSQATDPLFVARRNPDITVDLQGIVTVVWQSVIGPGNAGEANLDIFASRSDDVGQTFSIPINVSGDLDQSSDPRVATGSNGSIHIVWGDPNSGPVKYVRSLDGSTFDLPRNIISASRRPRIAMGAAGTIAVVSEGTFFVGSTDNGETFTVAQLINGLGNKHPDVAVESATYIDGAIDIVAQVDGYSGFPAPLTFASSGDGGVTFRTLKLADTQGDVPIGNGIQETGLPRIAIGSGIHIVWYDRTASGFDTFYTKGKVPTPVLTFLRSEPLSTGCTLGDSCTRYYLSVSNWQLFPSQLFVPYEKYRRTGGYVLEWGEGPILPPLAWISDLTSPWSLTQIYFDIPTGNPPPTVVKLALVDFANSIGDESGFPWDDYVTYWSNLLEIGTDPVSNGYAPISLNLRQGGFTNEYKFPDDQLNTFNYKVTYPRFTPTQPEYSGNANLIVQPILISPQDLIDLVAGSNFVGVSLVRYAGTPGDSGVLFRATCEDVDHNPVDCPNPGNYYVNTSWNSTGQSITAPAFLKAPQGTRDWEDILTAYYEDRIDPTGRGGTCCRLSDFVIVDRGESTTAGTPLPTITINSPTEVVTYQANSLIVADYSCAASSGPTLVSCLGTVPPGKPINTSSAGTKTFEVNATVTLGTPPRSVSYIKSVSYKVGSGGIHLLYNPNTPIKSGWPLLIMLELHDASGNDVSSPKIRLKAVSIVPASSNAGGTPSGFAKQCKDFLYVPWPGTKGRYIFLLDTRGLRTGSYLLQLSVSTNSGSYAAPFKIK